MVLLYSRGYTEKDSVSITDRKANMPLQIPKTAYLKRARYLTTSTDMNNKTPLPKQRDKQKPFVPPINQNTILSNTELLTGNSNSSDFRLFYTLHHSPKKTDKKELDLPRESLLNISKQTSRKLLKIDTLHLL